MSIVIRKNVDKEGKPATHPFAASAPLDVLNTIADRLGINYASNYSANDGDGQALLLTKEKYEALIAMRAADSTGESTDLIIDSTGESNGPDESPDSPPALSGSDASEPSTEDPGVPETPETQTEAKPN